MKSLALILAMLLSVGLCANEGIFSGIGISKTPVTLNTEISTSLGSLTILNGSVLVKSNGEEEFNTAENGLRLSPGDLIKTNQDSKARIEYDDKSYLMLKTNTYIQIKTAGISVRNGRVWVTVMKRNGKFEVETPAFVAGVRGTDFEVNVKPSANRAFLKLCDGIVNVTTDRDELQVSGGEMASVHKENREIKVSRFDPEMSYMDWGIPVNYNDEDLELIQIQRKINALEPLLNLSRPKEEKDLIQKRILNLYKLKASK